MGVKVAGIAEVKAQIKRLPKQFRDASAVGQFNAAQVTVELAKTRAPFEHGALEAAAFVEFPRFTAAGVVVDFGFSGLDYIAVQHENTDFNHPGLGSRTSNPGRAAQGQPKFLETAMSDTEDDTVRSVEAAVDYFIRNGSLPPMKGSIPGRSGD